MIVLHWVSYIFIAVALRNLRGGGRAKSDDRTALRGGGLTARSAALGSPSKL
jgi:hypothetical protein